MAAGGGAQVAAAGLTAEELARGTSTTSAGVHAQPLAEFALFGLLAGSQAPPPAAPPAGLTVHAHVLPGLGELGLREVTVPAIDRLLASVHAHHGPGAATSTRSIPSGSLGLAVRHGLLTTDPVRDTPARRTPRTARGPRALTTDAARLLQERLIADPAAARQDLPDLVDLLLDTGLRIGGACALRPLDVDLDAATLTVTGTVIRERGRGLVIRDVPKTTAGRRTIALPPRTVELLRHRLTASATAENEPVVSPSPQRRLRDPSNTSGDLRRALGRGTASPRTAAVIRRAL